MASVAVLLLGAAAAGAVYAFGAGPAESDDPATIAEDKIEAREAERMYGEVGVLERDWADNLKQPGTQAMLIAAITAVTAGGGFCAARLLEQRNRDA
jgi:hypothetical protein